MKFRAGAICIAKREDITTVRCVLLSADLVYWKAQIIELIEKEEYSNLKVGDVVNWYANRFTIAEITAYEELENLFEAKYGKTTA